MAKPILLAAAVLCAAAAQAQTEISFYYPVAVGGPITKIIDGLAAVGERRHAWRRRRVPGL